LLNPRDKIRFHAHLISRRATRLRGATQTAIQPSAIDFARLLSLRYRLSVAAGPRLARVLPLKNAILIKQHQRYSINLAPHLSFHLPVETMVRLHTSPKVRNYEADRRRSVPAPSQLVPRIFARAQREEVLTAPSDRNTPGVLARPGVPQTETTNWPSMGRANGFASGLVIERRAAASQERLDAPLPDMKRLTNEVIQVLDRRIIAERERRGRI